jgi:DNA-binding SARP family transcriptional activator
MPLGGEKQRALLALLALRVNEVLGREWLLEELWGDDAPATAMKALQVYVSRLRKVLPPGVLRTRPPGYVLEIDPEQVDVHRFERLVTEAGKADPTEASALLRSALALWRGPPLAEFAHEPFAKPEADRLIDLELAALEDRIDADLVLGYQRELIPELRRMVEEHPHRERLRSQLMVALYRAGRQADALDAYQAARSALVKLGLEPGGALRMLERQILTQDPSLDLVHATPLARGDGGRALLPGTLVPTSPFPFIGRASELAVLRSLLKRAVGGEGGLVLLAAEVGGGKTRLVRELAREAVDDDVLVLYAPSDPANHAPYQAPLEWFAFLLRACDREALESLTGGADALPSLVSELAAANDELVGLKGDRVSHRYHLQTAVTNMLARMSRVRPLLLVVDDAHWADPATLQLLRALARTAPEGRILVIATLGDRSEDGEPILSETLADLSRLDGVTLVPVGKLDADDVSAFIRAATGMSPSPQLVSRIARATNGMPLRLCELWPDLRPGSGQPPAGELADGSC